MSQKGIFLLKVKEKCRRRYVGLSNRIGGSEVGFARTAQAQRNMYFEGAGGRCGMKALALGRPRVTLGNQSLKGEVTHLEFKNRSSSRGLGSRDAQEVQSNKQKLEI